MRNMRWNTFSAISSSDDDRVIDEVELSFPDDFRVSKRQSFEYFSSEYVNYFANHLSAKHTDLDPRFNCTGFTLLILFAPL
jgi:hypothetical protein